MNNTNSTPEQIKSSFIQAVEDNDYFSWKKPLLVAGSNHILLADKEKMHLALVLSLKHLDNKCFYGLYDIMVKKVVAFDDDILFDIFNAACYHKNIDAIKFLDQKLNLSSHFLQTTFTKEFTKISHLTNFEVLVNRPTNYSFYNLDFDVRKANNTFKHGFIVSCFKQDQEMIDYFLFGATIDESDKINNNNSMIQQQLCEIGFVVAFKSDYRLSLTLLEYLTNQKDKHIQLKNDIFQLDNYPIISDYYDYLKCNLTNNNNQEKYTFFNTILLEKRLHKELDPGDTQKNTTAAPRKQKV